MREIERLPLTEQQKKLIEDNLDFVYWWFNQLGIYDEDRRQDYLYAICKHIHLFDPSRGTIAAFFRAILSSKRLSIYTADKTINKTMERLNISLSDIAVKFDGGEVLTWEEILGRTDVNISEFEDNDFFNKFVEDIKKKDGITKHQLDIFLTYLNMGNQTEVAKIFGTTRSNISEAINRVRATLKKSVKDLDQRILNSEGLY